MLTSHFTVVEIFNNFPNWALSHGFSRNQATTSWSRHQGLGWLWLPSHQIRNAGRSQPKPRQAKPWQHYLATCLATRVHPNHNSTTQHPTPCYQHRAPITSTEHPFYCQFWSSHYHGWYLAKCHKKNSWTMCHSHKDGQTNNCYCTYCCSHLCQHTHITQYGCAMQH